MTDNLNLIDLRIKPCAYVQDVIEGSFVKLIEGTEYSGGQHIYSFKVSGENRIISLVNGDPEGATSLQSKAYGELSDINCKMLRPFETFADETLNVAKNLIDLKLKQQNQSTFGDKNLNNSYWMEINWEHAGITFNDMLKIVAEQTTHLFGLRKKGELIIDHYKSVGADQSHSFLKAADGKSLDNLILNFPIVKKLGSQVKINLKKVHVLGNK
ncbi:hypothetical protein HELRODRAFT_162592 [Helobdella robusta]|uniref:Uncharacterized protein n=1 Tax=Helobdella robusta TaxID=6412 RepID=T1ESW0_HELRO|nr:hypothetical protein HELRODRAFT_162592 [Helobdella robusta]ESN99101.1 hypothetical protein HELRODRAFT_162592 [Helobdella robusta]